MDAHSKNNLGNGSAAAATITRRINCNNCGKPGHSFYQCKSPIVSYGVIAFRINPNGEYEYLMIRRKDTLGFIDFMRGKYSVYNKEYVLNMIKQMTNAEKHRIKTDPFSKLWRDLWGDAAANLEQYKSEESNSRNKFEMLRNGIYTRSDCYNLEELVDSTPLIWIEPEWGFPKGRRNYQERDYDCAVREFCEETGYNLNQLVMVKNIQPFEEIFTGSNYKSYKHKYYLMYMRYEDTLTDRNVQTCEVSGSGWMSVVECVRLMRPYNVEKIRVLHSVDRMLKENKVHFVEDRDDSIDLDAATKQ
jgi:ADP-ribose pyrophosphatase YjhB (NUDIX family)